MEKFVAKGKMFLKNVENEKNKLKKKIEDKYKQYKEEKEMKSHKENIEGSDTIFKKKLHSKTFSLLAQNVLKLKKPEKQIENYNMNLYYNEIQPSLSMMLRENIEKVGVLDFFSEKVRSILKEYSDRGRDRNHFLYCIAVIGFHHKKGPVVEFIYPDEEFKNDENFEYFLTTVALPDADDYVYFTHIKDEKKILFGVSCYKQIKVTEEMRSKDPDLTRGFLQKAVCVLSEIPLFGSLMSKLEPITKAYFRQNNFKDNEILKTVYNNLNSSMKETYINTDYSELFIGFSLRNLLFNFKEKVLILWKALFLEKRILVYSNKPSAVSNFILALLALIPGTLHFTHKNNSINLVEGNLREYGLPLRLFNNKNQLLLYFTINNIDLFDTLESYLIGTTNFMIRSHKKARADIIIDIDTQKIEINDEKLKKKIALNDKEKDFITLLYKKACLNISEDEKKSWKQFEMLKSFNPEWEGSEDWIRQEFANYLKKILSDLALFTSYLKKHRQFNLNKAQQNPIITNCNESENNIKDIKFDLSDLEVEESDEEDFEGYISKSYTTTLKGGDDKNKKQIISEELKVFKREKKERKILMKSLKKYNMKWLFLWSNTVNFQYWLANYDENIGNLSINQTNLIEKQLIICENGDIYYGFLKNGVRNGSGLFCEKLTSFLYNGEWENDMKKGPGVINSFMNDYLFDGEFLENKKEGYGKLITNKLKFSGNFKGDLFHGNGILIDSSENIYDGEFYNGQKGGVGKWQTSNGDQYIGDFIKDLFDGKGQYTYANGDIYSGDFKNNKKHGYGVLQKKNNEAYQGEWENDLYHGQGILTKEDGTSFQGLFEKGILMEEEKSIIKYQNGDNYTGTVKEGLPEGLGIYKFSNGDIVEGSFHNGQLDKLENENNEKEK